MIPTSNPRPAPRPPPHSKLAFANPHALVSPFPIKEGAADCVGRSLPEDFIQQTPLSQPATPSQQTASRNNDQSNACRLWNRRSQCDPVIKSVRRRCRDQRTAARKRRTCIVAVSDFVDAGIVGVIKINV